MIERKNMKELYADLDYEEANILRQYEKDSMDIEAGAAIAHDQWAGWMQYLFNKCVINEDGTATMPAWAVERWTRQASTPYAKLPEEEKASDRVEAQRYIDWMREG